MVRFSQPVSWSDCSATFIARNLELDVYKCLNKVPNPDELVAGAGCGNTIVEEGEQCDCGLRKHCKRYIF